MQTNENHCLYDGLRSAEPLNRGFPNYSEIALLLWGKSPRGKGYGKGESTQGIE
ncbi:hypothetical protein HY991_05290 [Candidatus Micrarchaeota archaeon]|nr:hypothetical protein [Candidatus Micrarchaeota archaeon]